MRATWLQWTLSSRFAWSTLGGLALAASFPKMGLAGLAWIAPGLILLSALGRTGGETFRIGYIGGLAYALGAFSWLLFIPFPAGAIGGWLALSAYLGLYTGAWVWLCWQIFPGNRSAGQPGLALSIPAEHEPGSDRSQQFRSVAPAQFRSLILSGAEEAARFVRVSLPRRLLWAVLCALIWVGLEMILARLFTGFPWNLLGVSQYQILPLIQIAPFTGVYGVSFLVVWFSVSLGGAVLSLVSRPAQAKAWLGDLVLPLLVLLGVIAFGSGQLARGNQPHNRTLKAALIQPSIPQTLIWDTNQNALRFNQLIQLSERALSDATQAQLVVWPEAAVPNMLRYEYEIYQAVTNLTISRQVWMILGSDDAAPRPDGPERQYDYYNSSFLVSPRGELAASYRKRRLVAFGEYIPLERWMPFIRHLTPVGGSFTAGVEPVPFVIPELGVKTSILICFEDIFPHLTGEYVQPDTDFLLNLTNNGWFGESAAQWQHAANAVFRAVEHRIPLVRCGNNGLTCWVDRYGRMHEVYFPGTQDIYGAGYKIIEVPLLGVGEQRAPTFYTRHGDWFGWTCVAVSALLFGRLASLRLVSRRR